MTIHDDPVCWETGGWGKISAQGLRQAAATLDLLQYVPTPQLDQR